MIPITVREVTSSPAETIPADASVDRAGRLLREQSVGSVVVTDGDAVDGLLTNTDLVDLALDGVDLASTPVSEVMRRDPPTVDADASVQTAARRFDESTTKRLPVVADDSLVGVVTTTDLATYLPRLGRRLAADGGVTAATRPGTGSTAYDRVDWEFSDDGALPETVERGETFRFRKRLSEADVAAFAEASGDTNRLHVDDDFAADSRFGGRIVHGMLVAGAISATLARLPGTVVYLSQDLAFRAPVRVGETVSAAVTATEALGNDRWRFDTTVFDSDDQPVVEGEATVLLD